MRIKKTSISEVFEIVPKRFEDSRGFFSETWNKSCLKKSNIDIDFVQDNHSFSRRQGTIRGLHFQAPPNAQDKLVRCTRGAILDVAVDIRLGSPTFGDSVQVELSAQNGKQLFIPKGFAHGFVTLCDNTEVFYKCSDYYSPDCDRAISFDDPTIDIPWGVTRSNAVLSEKDAAAPNLADSIIPFTFGS